MEVFQIKIYQFKYFYIMSYYCNILYSINHDLTLNTKEFNRHKELVLKKLQYILKQ